MTKVENLILLINLLYHRRAVDIKTIMRECGISQRTAYRYLRSLDVAGLPVYFDVEAKGYRLADKAGALGHLSPEESAAVLLALEFLECSAGPGVFEPVHRALTKLQARFSGNSTELMARALAAISRLDDMPLLKELSVVVLVKLAHHLRKSVRINRRDISKGSVSTALNTPKLVYDKEWKVKDESTDERLEAIPIRDVISIEVV